MQNGNAGNALQPDHRQRASVSLWFAGNAPQGRGSAGFGVKAFISISSGDEQPVSTEHTHRTALGIATINVADYMGLIGGMRAVIRYLMSTNMRHFYTELFIYGSNQLVIEQMKGMRSVDDQRLVAIHEVTKGLELEFSKVEYEYITSDENSEAESLAEEACSLRSDPRTRVTYAPSIMGLIDAWVLGKRTLASQDVLTACNDPNYFMDARFLHSLPGGRVLLRNLRDPHPVAQVGGKESMTALGTVNLDVGVSWRRDSDHGLDPQPVAEGCINVIVVESLPVPLHVSHRNPSLNLFPGGIEINMSEFPVQFAASSLEGHYRDHPFWH